MKKICKKLCFWKNKNPVVACLALNGVIGKDGKLSSGLNIENTFPLIEKAFTTDGVKAVAVAINSPGGSPVQSELIYNAIREFSETKKIPVYTFARDVAASGGYWLLLSGDEIYAHNSSIIGSIGVIFSGFGFVDAIKKIGVERRVYTEGKNKAILDPFMPEENENIEILKDAQRDIFEEFTKLVKSRRHGKLKDEQGKLLCECNPCKCENCKCGENFLNEKIFTGAFWSGRKAAQLGLVDGIADLRSKMKEKFGDKVRFENISIKKGFFKSLLSEKTDFSSEIVSKIEEKVYFGRFGL